MSSLVAVVVACSSYGERGVAIPQSGMGKKGVDITRRKEGHENTEDRERNNLHSRFRDFFLSGKIIGMCMGNNKKAVYFPQSRDFSLHKKGVSCAHGHQGWVGEKDFPRSKCLPGLYGTK